MSQVHAQPRVEEHPSDSLGQRAIVARRHEQARLAVLYDCLQTAHPRAHDRRTAGHGLEGDQSERFGERRNGADVRRRVVQRELFLPARSDERNVRFHPVLVDEPSQLEDLLRLGCVVARIERPAHDQKTDITSQIWVPLEQ